MNYNSINTCDVNNGIGVRISLWVSGCTIRCKGCHNKQLWDKKNGQLFTNKETNQILQLLDNKYINGLSILGGEPLDDYNINEVKNIIVAVKNKFPEKDIWLWSGFEYSDVKEKLGDCLNLIDYIIAGPFIEEQKKELQYRGSSNQRVFKNGTDLQLD